MEIHQLGAINIPYSPGGVVSSSPSDPFTLPTDGGMVTLPADVTTPPFGGGTVSLPTEDITPAPVPVPTETPETPGGGPSNKKNLLLFGIAGIVLAYLLLRKK